MLVRTLLSFITIFLIEKVLSNKVSGEGIKKTPAYETPMTKHEIDKWRKEFWGTSMKTILK